MKIPRRKRKVTTITLDPEIVEKAREHNLNISRLSEGALKETIKKLEHEAKPMGAPEIKKGGVKEMTKKLPWATAAVIILVVAIGAWILWAPAAEVAPSGEEEEGLANPITSASSMTIVTGALPEPGLTTVFAGSKENSCIENIYIAAHGLTDPNNEVGPDFENTINASGGYVEISYDTRFDIIVAVTAHKDNMGQLKADFMKVSIDLRNDTGWDADDENSADTQEYLFENVAGTYTRVNVLWDNGGYGYILEADDNLVIESVRLWCKG